MEEIECSICFEVSNEHEKYPSQLKYLKEYIKKCSCNVFVHNNCIEIWYNTCGTCPICCKQMIYINIEYQYYYFIIDYFLISKNILYSTFSYIFKLRNLLLFCFFIMNIQNILNYFEKKYYYYDNSYTYPQML